MNNKRVSQRAFNALMGATVFYGLVANVIICIFFADTARQIVPSWGFLIGYFVCCIAGIVISGKSEKPLISFLGYNMVVIPVGLVVSVSVDVATAEQVLCGISMTALITLCMIIAATAFPKFFSKIGGMLFAVLVGLVIVEVILAFLQIPQQVTIWIGVILFSLYVGYDYWKAQQGPFTLDNAVDCAVSIYLDIINLFLRLLSASGKQSSKN